GLLGPHHTLRLPLCAAHGDPWLPRNLCAGLSLACQAALVVAACFDLRTGAAVIPPAAYLGAGALAVVSAFAAAVLHLSVVRATQIPNSSVHLSGVSPAFAEAVAEEERYFDGPPLDDSSVGPADLAGAADVARERWPGQGTPPAAAIRPGHPGSVREGQSDGP